jgi:hypothetical protein
MGVTVPSLTGGVQAACVGKSILTTVGMSDFAYDTEETFLFQGSILAAILEGWRHCAAPSANAIQARPCVITPAVPANLKRPSDACSR